MSKAILYDATMCVGCKLCEKACAERNSLPYDDAVAGRSQLSATKLTTLVTHGDKFMRRLCMNCEEPTCVSVCLVGAFKKTAAGPVVYDQSRCIGCRYCMLACPFQVPTYQWDKLFPIVKKCDMCAHRVAVGRPTACAEACPTGATQFGERDELIAEARKRIREKPDQYIHHIFGETEVGGTSVLILSSVPLSDFGYRSDYTDEPVPMLTWRVLEHVPDIATMGGVLLGGVWWITHRRQAVAEAEHAAEKEKEGKP